MNHLRTAHRIEGFAPEMYPELPEAALRETLVNALAHRDYTISAPVRLFIYDDRVSHSHAPAWEWESGRSASSGPTGSQNDAERL